MIKILKWVILFLGCIVLFGFWYNWKYSMGIAESTSINNIELENRLLIATQQSAYKDKVTKFITDYYKGKEIYISVIDVNNLNNSLLNKYDAFVLIHTYQMWMPPEKVSAFLENEEEKNRIFTISTSGSGDVLPEGVDGVSSASIILDAEKEAQETIDWINNQFRKDT